MSTTNKLSNCCAVTSRVLAVILLMAGFTVSLTMAQTDNWQAENVVIIFMGGIRNSDAFDDSTTTYMPRIWNNIRPHGVIYRDFENMAFTGMGTGTFEGLMGVRRDENNRGTSWRGLSPGIFEYYRKDCWTEQDKVWGVLSNDFDCYGIDYGLHPAYGLPYAASKWGNANNNDIETFHKAVSVMINYHPSLLTIHFRDPDREAQHTYNPNLPDSIAWENYTHAVARVDSLVNLVWTLIQYDSVYSGKTALFITCAHGRHTPLFGGFEWHGDSCDGCRRVPFLAVGPDFKVGETIDIRGDLIDLCPTVGELLGFDPVFSRGRVLRELFKDPPENEGESSIGYCPQTDESDGETYIMSSPGAYAHSPQVEVVGDVVHSIWTERNTDEILEAWNIMYVRSENRGKTWSDATPLFVTDDPARKVYTVASMSGDTSGIAVITALYKKDEYWLGDTAWYWGSECKVSLDGAQWPEEPTSIIKSAKLLNIDNIPAVGMRDSVIATALLADRWNRYFAVTFDLGETWYNVHVDIASDDPFTSPNNPSVVVDEHLYYTESVRFTYRSRLPFFLSEGDKIQIFSIVDDDNSESFFPQLAYDGSTLYCVWNDDRAGNWEVRFSKSTDSGFSWSPSVPLSQGGVNTWCSAIEASHDTLLVVWEDFREGSSSLYKKISLNGGTNWSDDYPEVVTPGLSSFPKLSYGNGTFYMVWQDYRNGNWGVYFKKVRIELPAES